MSDLKELRQKAQARRQELQSRSGLREKIAARRAELQTPEQRFGPIPENAPEGAYYNERGQVVDPMLEAKNVVRQNPVAARFQEFIQGTPLVGEYADELVEMVNPQAAQDMRRTSDAMELAYPNQSAALNMTGSIVQSLPYIVGKPLKSGVDFISRGRGVLGKGLRAGVVAAPAAAVEGAAQQSGRADSGERLPAAGRGAVVGSGLALALGPFATALGAGAKNVATRVKRLDVRRIADELGVSPSVARIIKSHLKNDDIDAAVARMNRAGDDAMLADAGPGARQALDNSMATGGAALSAARGPVNKRAEKAGQQLTQTLDDLLGPATGVRAATKSIAKRTSAKRKAAYNRAYSQPTPMVGEAAAQIDSVLARVDPDVFKQALREAAAEMRNDGITNPNIMAQIADDGTVTFSQPPSVMELDYLARGLANVADDGTDNMTGKMSRPAQRAMEQARALRDTLKKSVDGYSRALRLGGDAIREREALLMGRKLLNRNTTFEDVRDAMRGAPDPVKAAARQGLRQNLDTIMGNARTTLASLEEGRFDFDEGIDAARSALAAVKSLTTPENFKKLRLVLGTDAKQFIDEVQRTTDALALQAALARNSATAIRTAGREQMAAEAQPGLVRRMAGEAAVPWDSARELTRSAAGTDAATIQSLIEENAEGVVRALTQIQGADAKRALSIVRDAMQGQPIRDEQAALIGRLVGGSFGLGAHQSTQQAIRPR